MVIVLVQCYSSYVTPAYQYLAKAYASAGHSAYVMQLNAAGFLEHFRDGDNEPCIVGRDPIRLPWRGSYREWLRAAAAFGKALRELRPDAVFVNMTKAGWLISRIGPATAVYVSDVRQVGRAHGYGARAIASDWKTRMSLRLTRALFFDSTAFLAPAAAKWAFGTKWQDRVMIVPLAVPSEYLDHRREAPDRVNQPVEFLYSGTISRTRRLETIISAASILKAKDLQFCVTFLGKDTSDGYYEHLTDERGLSDEVRFAGYVATKALAKRITSADVGLAYIPMTRVYMRQPSLKALEYRALGMPMIGTETQSNRELIEPSRNGILVKDDVTCLAAAMERFIVDRRFHVATRRWASVHRTVRTWDDAAAMAILALNGPAARVKTNRHRWI